MAKIAFALLALAASPALGSFCEPITSWITVTAVTDSPEPTTLFTKTISKLAEVTPVHKPVQADEHVTAFPTLPEATPVSKPEKAEGPVTFPVLPEVSVIPVPEKDAGPGPEKGTGGGKPLGESVSGKATFYGGNLQGGTCSFSGYTLPAGLYGAAFSGSAWDSAAHCGECVEVTGPSGKTLTAMIVDQCPECDKGHLDLFQNAFAELADISKGIIEISYKFVECGISSPAQLKNKEGTSPYWFSTQVFNTNSPVSKLEVSTDNGNTWQATTRKDYNYFENPSGFRTNSVSIRVTSIDGKTIVRDNVSVEANLKTPLASNF